MGKFEGTDFDNVDQKLTIGDIRGDYTAWRSRWNKGREWGIVGGAIGGDPKPDTVLDQVLEHGDSTYARDQARSIEGLGTMLESLTEIFDGDVIETSHVDKLQKDIDSLMAVLSEKNWNPRNIPFTTVIEFTETDDPKKPIIKRGEVFGHYRTKAYNQYVEWGKENKKNFRGQSANSQDEWYDEKPGKAKPPLWQAITGEGETEFGKNGILAIARNAIKTIKKIKVGDSTRIAVFNNAKGPTQLAQIKSVQEKVIQVLQNPSIYPAGKSRAPMKDRLNAAFTNETYAIRNKQEAELLNFAKGFDRVEGIEKIKGIQLRFPSNNLALNKTIKLVLQNLGEELQQYMTPKAKDGTSKPGLVLKQKQKEIESDNMNWKEILKYCGKEVEDPWHETEPPLPAANIENLSSKQKKIAEQAEPKDEITGEDFKRLKNKKSKGRSAFTAQD